MSYQAPSHAPAQHPQAPLPAVAPPAGVAQQITEYVEIAGVGPRKLATIGQRAGARILDSIIVWAIAGLVFVIISSVATAATAAASGGGGQVSDAQGFGLVGGIILAGVISVIVFYAYEAVMIGLWGATLGKRLLNVRVVRATTGALPGIGTGAVRYLIPGLTGIIPFIGSVLPLICFVSPAFDGSGRRQGWHDKIANTVVLDARGF